jgi:hypothetical protein
VVLILVCTGIAAGIATLLGLRFERGDVYPTGSSLRSDPLGSRVLYEALDRLELVVVERNLEPISELAGDHGTTLLLLGVSEPALEAISPVLAAAARRGVRVVATLAVAPGRSSPWHESTPDGAGLWGLSTAWRSLEEHPDDDRVIAAPATLSADLDLPAQLSWRSPIVLAVDDPDWQVVYTRDEDAVLVERAIGAGSLVVATDPFLLSNEAMLSDRHPDLLAWIIGPARRVVFDEVHLGVARPQGIMVLVRRYRLTGFFAALGVLAAVYVWRVALPFAPPAGDRAEDDPATHPRSTSAALVHLLRRGLAGTQLVHACVTVWKRSFAAAADPSLVRELDRLANSPDDPAITYERMRQTLERTSRHGSPAQHRAHPLP